MSNVWKIFYDFTKNSYLLPRHFKLSDILVDVASSDKDLDEFVVLSVVRAQVVLFVLVQSREGEAHGRRTFEYALEERCHQRQLLWREQLQVRARIRQITQFHVGKHGFET